MISHRESQSRTQNIEIKDSEMLDGISDVVYRTHKTEVVFQRTGWQGCVLFAMILGL